MDEKLTIFIAVTAAAVVLQMLILFAMYLSVRKLSARMESVVDETQSRVFPLLENGKADPAGHQDIPGDSASQD